MILPIAKLLQANDIPALAERIRERWGLAPSAEVLEGLHVLAFGESPIPCGGTKEQPWSDSTWMLWIKNRLDDLGRPSGPKKLAELVERHRPTPPSDRESWLTLLQRFNKELLSRGDLEGIDPEARERNWLGFPPADEAAIAGAERRIGRRLPPSLRLFYAITNGWATFGYEDRGILPVEQIGWLRDVDPGLYQLAETMEATPGPFPDDPSDARLLACRDEQGTRVKRALVVSDRGAYSTLLLDPGPEPHDGEWPGGDWSSDQAMEWSSSGFAELLSRERKRALDVLGDEDD